MAGKKSKSTSKTDHVLSLLSGGGAEPPASQPTQELPVVPPQVQDQEPAQEKEEPAAPADRAPKRPARTRQKSSRTQKSATPGPSEADVAPPPASREGERLTAPILQVARTNNDALSETIRDALSQALDEELAQQAHSDAEISPPLQPGSELPVPQETPGTGLEDTEPPSNSESPPVPQPEPEPAPVPEVPEPSTEMPPDLPFAPREVRLADGAVCINVMETLVDERLERYVKMFGLCNCPRCLADARALSLTRLPSKCVVLSASAATPMLSLYRAKFESLVIAQVIQACKTVLESPRHTL